jgi:hypothetical protein
MTKVIKVKLTPKSIDDAIKELNEYKRDLELRAQELVKKLTDYGANIARAKLVSYEAYNFGDLFNSIDGIATGDYGVIKVDSDYAVFVEFGTGPVGKAKSHPSGKGKYRDTGWYTKADGKPMDVWYGWTPIVTDEGDVIYYTDGQTSKPFMYETALQLKDEFPAIVKEVFG